MKVLIQKLYDGYDYNDGVETFIGSTIAKRINKQFHDQTRGFNAKYDFMWDTKKIELKFTSLCEPAIEFARANYKPSGLMLSESDYYLIISPGGSNNKFVGKIRLYKRYALIEKFIKSISNPLEGNIKKYNSSYNSPGAICFTINPKEIEHIWVGDCDLIMDGKKVIGFDLNTIKFARLNSSMI